MVLAGLYLGIAAATQTHGDRAPQTDGATQPSLRPTPSQRTVAIPGSTLEVELPDLPELPPLPEDIGRSDSADAFDSPRAWWSIGLIGLGGGLLTFAVSGRLTKRQRAALQFRPREPGEEVENLGDMLLVEELLLLLTKDSGALFGRWNAYLELALDAACALDLEEQRRALGTARLEPARAASLADAPPDKIPRAGPTDRTPARRLAALIDLPDKAPRWMRASWRPSKGLRYAVFDELSSRASRQDLSNTRACLRAKLEDILLRADTPDRHTASLIALLSAVGAASWVVDPPDRRVRKAINQHAAEILAGSPQAVRDVIVDYRRRTRREAMRGG